MKRGRRYSPARVHVMGANRAREQSQPSNEQDQHYESVEEARRLKIDVHVGNYACQNEEISGNGQQPPYNALAPPEQKAYTKQHRYQGNTERVCPPEAPIGTDHGHLIGQKVSTDTSHDEAHQEFAESTGRPAYIAYRTVFHGPSISDMGARFEELC